MIARAEGGPVWKGNHDMTKAKARQRAKAKAAEKIKKRRDNADQPAQETGPGQFDAREKSVPGPRESVRLTNVAGAMRGNARSR